MIIVSLCMLFEKTYLSEIHRIFFKFFFSIILSKKKSVIIIIKIISHIFIYIYIHIFLFQISKRIYVLFTIRNSSLININAIIQGYANVLSAFSFIKKSVLLFSQFPDTSYRWFCYNNNQLNTF